MKWIVGIDEVGRGALAGPVVVVAAALAVDIKGLKDSKQLSAAQREAWSKKLRADKNVRFVIARVNPRGIEKLNISAAANKAALSAFVRLFKAEKLPLSTPFF